jgi:hypothetical protein
MDDRTSAAPLPEPDRIAAWLHAAVADATRRGLPELERLLEGLADSTRALRNANSQHRADR